MNVLIYIKWGPTFLNWWIIPFKIINLQTKIYLVFFSDFEYLAPLQSYKIFIHISSEKTYCILTGSWSSWRNLVTREMKRESPVTTIYAYPLCLRHFYLLLHRHRRDHRHSTAEKTSSMTKLPLCLYFYVLCISDVHLNRWGKSGFRVRISFFRRSREIQKYSAF